MEALALWRASQIHLDRGEIQIAFERCQANIALLQELGNTWSLVYSLVLMGDILQKNGDVDAARRQWETALRTAEQFPHHPEADSLTQRLM